MDSTGEFAYSVTNPSGAKADFEFEVMRHFRHNVGKICVKPTPTYEYLQIPNQPVVFSLTEKTVAGPGLPSMTWMYSYEQLHGLGFAEQCEQTPAMCPPGKTQVVTAPDGTLTSYEYGVLYGVNEGQLLGTELHGDTGDLVRSQGNVYVAAEEAETLPFPETVGINPLGFSDPLATRQLRPLKQSVTTQQGVDFSRAVNAYDVFARPTSVTSSSTLAGAPSRTAVTAYHDNVAKWILGQQASLTVDGVLASETSYDANALPTVFKRFGRTFQTLGYDTSSSVGSGQRGTVQTVADGNGNVTTLTSWKRGVPQLVEFPATPEAPSGATQSAVVSDHGLVTRITDENGYQTNYQYDPMGRLSRILHPTGDSPAWNDTILSLTEATSSAYGIPAGHWQHTVAMGNSRKVTYLNALWRPVLVREYDTADVSGTQRFTKQVFDHEGRVTFASYPGASGTPSDGTWTEYDALGRPTSVSQDSELGLLTTITQYLGNFQTRVTSPKGEQTTTGYLAWDQPMTDYPVTIAHPQGAHTDIARDAFGKPLSLTRRNGSGSASLTRHYVYDQHQQLCKSVEPETGATIMAYDGAGNLAWSKAGATHTGTTDCNTGDIPLVERTVRSYDARNRIQSLIFPDNLGNTTYDYSPDGLLDQITVDNGGADIVSTAYTYNRRRLLTGEALAVGSHQWSIGYGYDANGHLTVHLLPGGLTVDYAPNALGQPTQAGSYATGVTYFPDGAIKQFAYGNGVVHTLTQNARGLPDRSRDVGNGADIHDDGMDYDAHGNVAAISDGLPGHRGDRTMSYDGLDRLTGTDSPMFGTATYAYDVLDNLSRVSVTAGTEQRDHAYEYDAGNRLSLVTNTTGGATVAALTYDVQGNLASRNGQIFDFDHGNRLREAAGVERYLYDGHGRRVQAIRNGTSIYSVYGQDGVLRFQHDERAGQSIGYVHLGGSLVARLRDPLPGALQPPTLTVPAQSSTGNYTVSWTSIAGATHYELEERQGTGGWGLIHDAAGTSKAVEDHDEGGWDYRVRACDGAGCGDWSTIATILVELPPDPPDPPAGVPTLTAPSSSSSGDYAVSWTTVSGATRYELQEQVNGGSWSQIQDSGATSRELTGKAAGTYGYRVRACNDGGCAGYSSVQDTEVTLPPTSAPTLTVPSSNTTGSYTASWTTVSTATRYELQERTNGGSWGVIQDADATSHGLTGKASDTYDYRVRGCNTGGCGGYSSIQTTEVTRPPTGAPTLTAPSSNETGSYTVSWTTVSTATYYKLQERLGTGGWSLIQDDSTTSHALTDKANGSWGYRVRGCNTGGCGGYSSIQTVDVQLPPAPEVPLPILIVETLPDWFKANWAAATGATSYELRVVGDATFYSGPETSHEFGDLASNQYAVRACNAGGCSAWSAAVTPAPYNPGPIDPHENQTTDQAAASGEGAL